MNCYRYVKLVLQSLSHITMQLVPLQKCYSCPVWLSVVNACPEDVDPSADEGYSDHTFGVAVNGMVARCALNLPY